jgi:hypothetical protein
MVDDSILNDDLNQASIPPKIKSISLKYKICIALAFALGFFIYRLAYKKYMGTACNVDKYH